MTNEFSLPATVEEIKERPKPSVSVGVLLEWGYRSSIRTHLVLIHTKDGWGPPAGSMETGEKSVDTILREIREETGIPSNHIYFLNNFGNFGRESEQLTPLYFGDFFKEGRLYVGMIFLAKLVGVKFQKESWSITKDESVTEAKAFNAHEIIKLLKNTLNQETLDNKIRIPEFNFEAILMWLLRNPTKEVFRFLEKNSDRINGLEITADGRWRYFPPNFVKFHKPNAKKWLEWTEKFETIEEILEKRN